MLAQRAVAACFLAVKGQAIAVANADTAASATAVASASELQMHAGAMDLVSGREFRRKHRVGRSCKCGRSRPRLRGTDAVSTLASA